MKKNPIIFSVVVIVLFLILGVSNIYAQNPNAQSVLRSLNGQTGQNQFFTNDSNVSMTSFNDTHTLGWSGILPIIRGGTGTSSFNNGSVLFFSNGKISEDTLFFWDDINNQLGIGNSIPTERLDVAGNIRASAIVGLTTPLSVAQGGTGVSNLPFGGLLIGNGSNNVINTYNPIIESIHATSTNITSTFEGTVSIKDLIINGTCTGCAPTESKSSFSKFFTAGEPISSGDAVFLASVPKDIVVLDVGACCSGANKIFGIDNGSFREKIAQRFGGPQTFINKIKLRLKKTGSPTDSVRVTIQSDLDSHPSGVELTGASISASSLSDSFTPVTFELVGPTILANGVYWIVLERSGSFDIANYYEADASSLKPYGGT